MHSQSHSNIILINNLDVCKRSGFLCGHYNHFSSSKEAEINWQKCFYVLSSLNLLRTYDLRLCFGLPPKLEHFFVPETCLFKISMHNSCLFGFLFPRSYSSGFLIAATLRWQTQNPHDKLVRGSIVVGWALVLCVWADWGQHPLDYPLTLIRFPPAQSARPTVLWEKAGLSQALSWAPVPLVPILVPIRCCTGPASGNWIDKQDRYRTWNRKAWHRFIQHS